MESKDLFRHYEFEPGDVLEKARHFVRQVGYEVINPEPVGFVVPDIHGERDTSDKRCEILGIVLENMDDAEVVTAFARLQALKAVKGEDADYSLIMPPVNEYLLIEFLEKNQGWRYLALRDLNIMWWLLNPEEKNVWCIVGAPRDDLFLSYFTLEKVSFDQVVGMKIMRQSLLDEEDF